MLETLTYLLDGFARMMDAELLFFCFLGVLGGTLVGMLPGLGPASAIAILLPVTYGFDPLTALVMLSGMFYGGMFGGMITSILLNVPGEGASVATTFDGYPMAKAGKGGIALGVGAISSFIGGTMGIVFLTITAVPLARLALKFGPPEYFAVMFFTFACVTGLEGEDRKKSLFSLFIGLFFACIGMDVISGVPRFTLGLPQLLSGIDFIPAVVGLYGLAEILYTIIYPSELHIEKDTGKKFNFRSVFPNLSHIKATIGTIIRGGILGFFIGVLPGAGATLASFLSYGLAKRLSKHPEQFGKGAIQGVAAPESANNGSASGSFVPLFALGIPGSATTAVLIGAFILVGIQPGPRLYTHHGDIVWGLIASMYVGNVMLLFINTAMIPFFIWLLKITQRTLPVIVTTLCFVGVYGMNNAMSDVWIMLLFTVLGFGFRLAKIPGSPLLLALVLGQQTEQALRQSFVISNGSFLIFVTRPISAFLIAGGILFLVLPMIVGFWKRLRCKEA